MTSARQADHTAREALWQLLHVHRDRLERVDELALLPEIWEEEAEVLESFRRFDTWAEKNRWDTLGEIRTWVGNYVLRDAERRAKVRERQVGEPEIASDLRPLTRLAEGQHEKQEGAKPSGHAPEES